MISTAIGIIGIFLPILPTTPFLLLAAYCFARSSHKFYIWLNTNRLCGEYISNYRERKGIKLKHKILTILFLWLTIGYSVIFFVAIIWVKILLLIIAIAVSIHLIRLKTFRAPVTKNKLKNQFVESDKVLNS
jgi:uncharacterized membrane protein YbaN (DUF454 family)